MARVRLGVVDGGTFRTSAPSNSTPEGQLAVDAARSRLATEKLQQIYTGGKILATGAELFGPAVAGLISRIGDTSAEDQRANDVRLRAARAMRAKQKAEGEVADFQADRINALIPEDAAAKGAPVAPTAKRVPGIEWGG
jgi:hypothetical protein